MDRDLEGHLVAVEVVGEIPVGEGETNVAHLVLAVVLGRLADGGAQTVHSLHATLVHNSRCRLTIVLYSRILGSP